MPFLRVDDSLPDHRKYRRLSDAALGLWVRGSCYANRYLTDGHLDADFIEVELQSGVRQKLAAELVSRGIWEVTDTGYVIHDHLDYNPSREETEAKRAARAAAGRAGGKAGTNGKHVAHAGVKQT